MHKLRVTVDGRAYEVTVEMLDEPHAATPGYSSAWVPHTQPPPNPLPAPVVDPVAAAPQRGAALATPTGAILSPLAGKVVAIDVKVGDPVVEGAQVVTLEAMKMNTFVYAPKAGTVSAVHVNPGDAVEEGAALLTIV